VWNASEKIAIDDVERLFEFLPRNQVQLSDRLLAYRQSTAGKSSRSSSGNVNTLLALVVLLERHHIHRAIASMRGLHFLDNSFPATANSSPADERVSVAIKSSWLRIHLRHACLAQVLPVGSFRARSTSVWLRCSRTSAASAGAMRR